MLMTKETIDQLAGYLGSTPIPEDFDTFWAARMAEADQVSLDYSVSPSEIPAFDTCDYLDFWFRGMNGARLYAKYVKPRSDRPIPLVLQFHGYPGASRSWLEQSSYAGMGCALLALDCPGQGGLGDDPGGYAGTTVTGHIVAGLDGPPERMYYVRLHQNIRVLVAVIPHDDRAGIQPHHLRAVIAPVAGYDLISTLAAGTDDQRLGNAGALDAVHQPHQIGAGPVYGVRLPRIGEYLLRRHDLHPLLPVGTSLYVCFEQVIVPGQLYAV